MRNVLVKIFALGTIILALSCSGTGDIRWDLEVTGKVPIASSICDSRAVQSPCGEVWWLDSSLEKHYKTWPIASSCYSGARIGYDLSDVCRWYSVLL